MKLVHITTVPVSLWLFLRGQVGFMQAKGITVEAIASPGDDLQRFAERESVRVEAIEMARSISPHRDLLALWRLSRSLRETSPDIVHASTPKGGLLGMLAAWLAHVPARIYHIRGLPMMTATGYQRVILRWSEKLSCLLAHRVICVSHSIRDVAIADRLCPPEKITVLHHGSSNGVDTSERYNPDLLPDSARAEVRAKLDIPEHATVVGFVGRVVRDKGMVELVDAWQRLRETFPALYLLVVGPFEVRDAIPAETARVLRDDTRIRAIGHTDDLAPCYAAMDVLALPSHREGFPNVPLEAAGMRLPVVATRIPGCIDAIEDGVTGTLVPVGNAPALAAAIAAYVRDPVLRHAHGAAGQERAVRDFRQEVIWQALYDEYRVLLDTRGRSRYRRGA